MMASNYDIPSDKIDVVNTYVTYKGNKYTIEDGTFALTVSDVKVNLEADVIMTSDVKFYKESITYVIPQSKSTGIIDVRTGQPAVVKTIENGRVVVIREGVKYGIDGRKL